ncbi:hypothetical protein MMC07_009432 [Pseudocyphellaria aurata]|nr:hypothetical protein [Pseudocyphellaria aurata]
MPLTSAHTTDSFPIKKRRKRNRGRRRLPTAFWDNLSRLFLTPLSLEEFDRRTASAPLPPHLSSKKAICPAQLKIFARHGGPDLGDLRDYPDPNRAVLSTTKASTPKLSARDPAFLQYLEDHGFYPIYYDGCDDDNDVRHPHNLEEIRARLAMRRKSLSPSRFTNKAFEDFKRKALCAPNETAVMMGLFWIVAGSAEDSYRANILFDNLEDLIDDSLTKVSLTKAQPAFYDGSLPRKVKVRVREELGPFIVPSTNTSLPCLPNFFVECNGPDEDDQDVARRQALYYGVLGARGMHKLRSYVDPDTAYDSNAYTITCTYTTRGLLEIYTIHASPSKNPDFSEEYRMTMIHSISLVGEAEYFQQGAGALRNARDWAKEKREELIAAANSKPLNAERPAVSPATPMSIMAQSSDESVQRNYHTANIMTLNTEQTGAGSATPLIIASQNDSVQPDSRLSTYELTPNVGTIRRNKSSQRHSDTSTDELARDTGTYHVSTPVTIRRSSRISKKTSIFTPVTTRMSNRSSKKTSSSKRRTSV